MKLAQGADSRVRDIQFRLIEMGYTLATDGVAGPLTWAAIGKALAVPCLAPTSAIAMINAALLRVACPERTSVELEPWVAPLRAACSRFEINTIRRVAAFLAQIAHESGFKPRQESLNYSIAGLLKTFGRHRISAANAARLGRAQSRHADQEGIACAIYGGEWGHTNLGNTQAKDGWTFRGVGPLQITGRGNMTRFASAMNMTLDDAMTYARTLEGGIMAAAWFWEANDINRLADTPGVTDETRAINGGTNGLADRETRFNNTVAAMLKLEKIA